jgi:alkyl hydroperoxide reductase subunit AhpF
MALANKRVRATAVEAQEFAELSRRYEVYAVPKIVVNDSFEFTGGFPETQFVDLILTGSAGGDAIEGEKTAIE